MKLPIKKSPIQSSRLNITYDELLKLDFNQLKCILFKGYTFYREKTYTERSVIA